MTMAMIVTRVPVSRDMPGYNVRQVNVDYLFEIIIIIINSIYAVTDARTEQKTLFYS